MRKIIEFKSWATPNTLYQRGHKFYLGGGDCELKLVTVKQAIRWFLHCRQHAQVFTHKGGIEFLLAYALHE
jgi:hypothetical protein